MSNHKPKTAPQIAPLGELKVTATNAGQRLDRLLKSSFPTVPYIAVQKLIRTGKVRINGTKAKADARLQEADIITFPPNLKSPAERLNPSGTSKTTNPYQLTKADLQWLEQATIYEDDSLLVLNKPAGLPAQAGGSQTRSLDRILAAAYGEQKAPKLTHRLDRETTGLIVCAKTRTAAAHVTAQFAARQVQKSYLALLQGNLKGSSGEICHPILKVGALAKVSPQGDSAHTTWQLLSHQEANTHLVQCTPHTGRMNQLRVHFAHQGTPIVGDDKYATQSSSKKPLFLHAHTLTLTHPKTGQILSFIAPLPAHFAGLTPPPHHASIAKIIAK
ncbi:MAG: RluA family pseudouridine synthase [Proteobacteria bacterium]|nr:RluA family pseudouridine synthase [Pseudomonadota bacterium]